MGRPFCHLAAAAVIVVVAAVPVAAAAIAAAAKGVAVAAAEEQQDQNDDPPAVVATTIVTAHKTYLRRFFGAVYRSFHVIPELHFCAAKHWGVNFELSFSYRAHPKGPL